MIRTGNTHFVQTLLPVLPINRIVVLVKSITHCLKTLLPTERGFSVLELVTALGIAGIMAGTALSGIQSLERPLPTAASQLSGFFKQVRAKAIATTSAYTITAVTSTQVIASYSSSCDSISPTQDSKLLYNFPSKVALIGGGWSLCFNPRGLANNNAQIYIQDDDHNYRRIEVFLGGAIRVTSL